MHKTKQIQKPPKQNSKHSRSKVSKKPIVDEHGDPLIKNLSDFVTSIKIVHSSKPIYTGGRILAACKHIYATCNGEVVVYSVDTGDVVSRIKYADQEIVNFAVSSDQKHIITFTQNSMVRSQSINTLKILHSTKLSSSTFANDIQFSPDNRHIAIALGNSIHIYTFETMKRTHTYNPTHSKFVITKLAWHPHPDKLQIYSVDLQRNIAIFDYVINKVIAVTTMGNGGTDFAIDAKSHIVVAVDNQQIRYLDASTLTIKGTLDVQEYFQSVHIAENHIFLGGQQSQLYSLPISSLTNMTQIKSLKKHKHCTDNGVVKLMQCGSPSSPSFRLLVLSIEQNISVLSLITKNNNLSLKQEGMIVGFNDEIIDIKNSKTHIEIGEEENSNENELSSEYFVLVTNSNNIKVMNKRTNKMEHLVTGHTNTVLCADFWYPYIATAGKDNVCKLWRINNQKKIVEHLANYNGHSADIVSLVALPNSKIIATASEDYTIKLWAMCLQVEHKVQIKSSIRTAIAHQKSINSIRASACETYLATCSQDRTIKVFNMNLTCIFTLAGHRRSVWDVAFHPVQKLLVSVGGDGMIKGWSLESGDCTWSLGQGAALMRCCFLYYNQVVTGSQDGIVKIWDIRKQTSISYDKHEGKIWALDVHKPNNSPIQLFTGATDSTYHVWADNTGELKQQIMHNNQLEEQQRIFYDQHMSNRNYSDGAVVAFRAGYTKLFMDAVCKIDAHTQLVDCAVDFDADGHIVPASTMKDADGDTDHEMTQQQFCNMVKQLKEIDLNRLLLNIQAMSATVKMYRISNRLLLELIRCSSFTELTALNSNFTLPEDKEPTDLSAFNEKKSHLMKWLQSMISNEQKHLTRLNKYILGTHWIEHLYRRQNPFEYDNMGQ